MTLGAYYAYDPNQRIAQALASLGDAAPIDQLTAEAVQQVLASVPPLGSYVIWGSQDGSVDWTTISQPTEDLTVFPISDAQLNAIQRGTFGQPLGAVAILTTKPMAVSAAEKAFDDTPYKFHGVDGVYSLADPASVPTILFLYWGRIREPDDGGGGNAALQSAAAQLSGALVFPLPVPRTGKERPHPMVGFGAALAAQLNPTPIAPAAAFLPQPKATASLKWLFLPVVGACAAALGYKFWKDRKKAAG